MPYPLVPPPTSDIGALTVPRTLQRWLDDNPCSPLVRVGTYITLPTFTQSANTWNGYSDIVLSYNFEAAHNFSLKNIAYPVNPNYTLCVSYRVGAVIMRYAIWQAAGTNLPFATPLYTGQFIKKNFRFEIWNTSQGAAVNVSAIIFVTSVLGGIDYRWGTDSALVGNDGQVSAFANVNRAIPATTVPNVFTQFITGQGVVTGFGSWTDRLQSIVWSGSVIGSSGGTFNLNGSISGDAGISDSSPLSCAFLFVIYPTVASATIIDNTLGTNLSYSSVTRVFTAFTSGIGTYKMPVNPSTLPVVIVLDGIAGIAYIWNATTGALLDTIKGTIPIGGDSTVTLTSAGDFTRFYEILLYNTNTGIGAAENCYEYFHNKYFNTVPQFTLPLTFPANSVSTTN